MCGRFACAEHLNIIAEYYSIDEIYSRSPPNYNASPGNSIPSIIRRDNSRILKDFRWGLVPHWAKDPKIGYKMINARSETVSEKPGFKKALASGRCLIAAGGFFEWEKRKEEKFPVYIHLKDKKLMVMAGLREKWVSGEDEILETCAILTTAPNSLLGPIHDRMPVIIHDKDIDMWLDTERYSIQEVLPLLKPYPPEKMKYHYVSGMVNSPKNNSPECIAPVE